ncbi:MAG: nucleotidyltransferase family protein [Bacteroidaceae bacterium]|nr:nucleotidyltransferase family protein [Bacteroidaceae bacterium]
MFDVIILAGGLGTRLRSVVSDVPKCMAPVGGRPFLAWTMQWLERFDVGHVVLSLGYLSNVVIDWIRDEYKGKIPVDWVIEETPLGTGGGIRLAMSRIRSDYAVILNGDTFFNVDLNAFHSFSMGAAIPLTVALKPMTDFDRYGSVTLTTNGRIASFNEKKHCDEGLINGGIYCIDSRYPLFDGLQEKFSFEKEILEPMSGSGDIAGFISDGSFIDIGIPQDYQLAQTFLPANI